MVEYKLGLQSLLRNQVKICLILLSVSFSAMLLASHTTHIQIYPPDPFYLFTSLSIYYWIGVFFLLALIVLRVLIDAPYTKFIQLVDVLTLCLLAFYYSIVTFIYPTIRYVDSYSFYWNLLNPIISAGTLDVNINYPSMYHIIFNGTTIYFSSIFQLDISPHIISNSVPILVITLGSLFTYLLSKKYSSRYSLVGGIIFIIFSWDACHMAPQHLTYVIAFSLIYLVLSLFTNSKNIKVYMYLILICLTTLLLSHLLTNIIIFYLLISLYVIFALTQLRSEHLTNMFCFKPIMALFGQMKEYQSKKNLLILPILYMFVAFTSYLIYLSARYSSKLVNTINDIVHSFIEPNEIVLMHRTVVNAIPSDSYMLMYELRMGILFLYLILGTLFSLIVFYLHIRETKYIQNAPYSIIIVITFLSLFLFGGSLLATGNATYGFGRAYPLSLIPFGVLITIILNLKVPSLKSRKIDKFLILSLIIAIILVLPILKYGSDPYHFFSESEDKTEQFKMQYIGKNDSSLYRYNIYSNRIYNFKVLKEQTGLDYRNQFTTKQLHLIYNVGYTSLIFGKV